MKQNKSNYYFTTILLIHILVYFFKIDRDVFVLQEFYSRPDQTYTEQPFLRNSSNLSRMNSIFSNISKPCEVKNNCLENNAIWNSILLSYNVRIHHLLKHSEPCFPQTDRIIYVVHRKNIFHKSSKDEESGN